MLRTLLCFLYGLINRLVGAPHANHKSLAQVIKGALLLCCDHQSMVASRTRLHDQERPVPQPDKGDPSTFLARLALWYRNQLRDHRPALAQAVPIGLCVIRGNQYRMARYGLPRCRCHIHMPPAGTCPCRTCAARLTCLAHTALSAIHRLLRCYGCAINRGLGVLAQRAEVVIVRLHPLAIGEQPELQIGRRGCGGKLRTNQVPFRYGSHDGDQSAEILLQGGAAVRAVDWLQPIFPAGQCVFCFTYLCPADIS